MIELITTWWPVIPSIIAAASVIAKITGNETAVKWIYYVQKIVDKLALTTGKTVLKQKGE